MREKFNSWNLVTVSINIYRTSRVYFFFFFYFWSPKRGSLKTTRYETRCCTLVLSTWRSIFIFKLYIYICLTLSIYSRCTWDRKFRSIEKNKIKFVFTMKKIVRGQKFRELISPGWFSYLYVDVWDICSIFYDVQNI